MTSYVAQRSASLGRSVGMGAYYGDVGTLDLPMRDQSLTAGAPVFPAFRFESRRSRIDWRVLHGIDVNPIVSLSRPAPCPMKAVLLHAGSANFMHALHAYSPTARMSFRWEGSHGHQHPIRVDSTHVKLMLVGDRGPAHTRLTCMRMLLCAISFLPRTQIRDVDLDTLEKVVSVIAFGDIEAEDTRNLTELNFVKVQRRPCLST